MSADRNIEAGSPTIWDNAWQEGHAHGLASGLGIPYRDAWLRTVQMLNGEPLDRTVTGNQVRRKDGAWVPSIPEPLYGIRKRCGCGKHFWTLSGYQGHYALAHVLGTQKEAS